MLPIQSIPGAHDLVGDSSVPAVLVDLDGAVLGEGVLDFHPTGLRLRHVRPSGTVASAYFERGQRQFWLAAPSRGVVAVQMVNCRWQDGARICDLVLLEGDMVD